MILLALLPAILPYVAGDHAYYGEGSYCLDVSVCNYDGIVCYREETGDTCCTNGKCSFFTVVEKKFYPRPK